MIFTVVRHLSRWTPPSEVVEPPDDAWLDTDTSHHNSSYELSQGLDVIEHFEQLADTRPVFNPAQGKR